MRKLLPAYLALSAVCIIWGTTFLALRIAVTHFPAFLFSGVRQMTAGIILLCILIIYNKRKFPNYKHLVQQATGGFLMITIGNGLVAYGETDVPSGLASIICSLIPIVTIIINLLVNRAEKPSALLLTGSILGLLGIFTIFSGSLSDFSNPEYGIGIFLIFISTIGWAAGSVWLKHRNADSDPLVNAGLQMFFGGLFMFPCSLLFDDLTSITWTNEILYSLFYLIIFGSLVAYSCYLYALRKLSVTVVSLYAYINPLVAILLGWVILDEVLNARILGAIAITTLGVYLVNKSNNK